MQMSFGSLEVAHRLGKGSTLMKVQQLIDWSQVRKELAGMYRYEQRNAGGQVPFDPVMMFKAIVLGQWHSLSDPKLEEALRVRLDFIAFCGLQLDSVVPDETTLCRFRNRLIHERATAQTAGPH